MSDRLQELLRQKALLDEQASWLAREIAAERARSGTGPQPAATPPAPAPVPSAALPASGAPPAAAAALDAEAEAIIDQYRDPGRPLHQQVKRGCILYFLAALALVALGVLAIYLAAHRQGAPVPPARPPAHGAARSP